MLQTLLRLAELPGPFSVPVPRLNALAPSLPAENRIGQIDAIVSTVGSQGWLPRGSAKTALKNCQFWPQQYQLIIKS